MKCPTPLALAFCLIVLYELEENIITSPIVRMLEDAICQQYYASKSIGNGNVPESSCKIDVVQQKLAHITGYYGLFKNIPGNKTHSPPPPANHASNFSTTGIILGSYFSRLAGTLGRRPVYGLNMVGMICEVLSTYLICMLQSRSGSLGE